MEDLLVGNNITNTTTRSITLAPLREKDMHVRPSVVVGVHLLVVLLVSGGIVTTASSSLGSLSLYSSRSAATVWRSEGEIDVFLGVESDDERRDVDNLLADSDMSLSDENSGVVDGFGETRLEDLGLKSSLHEVLDLQGEYVIEFHPGLIEYTDSDESSDQSVTFKESLWVLVVEL